LEGLKVVFGTPTLLTKEYLPSALKAYIGISPFAPLKGKLTPRPLSIFIFADNMLSNINKIEMVERTKKMRATASMNKDLYCKRGKLQLVLLRSNPIRTSKPPQALSPRGKD